MRWMWERIDRFLFAPVPPLLYAWLRLALGTLAVAGMLPYAEHLLLLYSDSGFYPVPAQLAQEGGLHRFSLLFWVRSPEGVWACYLTTLVLGALYAVGFLTPLTGLALWIFWISFVHRNLFASYGAQQLMSQLLFLMMWAPAGRVWSVDAWLARRLGHRRIQPAWPLVLRLLRFQVCLMYLSSGWHKLMGGTWVDGTAVLYPLLHPIYRFWDLDGLILWPPVLFLLRCFTWTVLAWELTFPLLVAFPRTRAGALLLGAFIHLSQWLTVETGIFPPLLLASYLAFLDPDKVDAWVHAQAAGGVRQLHHGEIQPSRPEPASPDL